MSPAGSSDSRTDHALVAALNRGDASAFETLYLRHRDWAWRVARRFARDDAEAADAVQDAFLQFLTRFPGFRLSGKLTTFLYPVVRNVAISAARRSHRLAFTDKPPEPEASPVPASSSSDLQAALARLPEAHREVLLMRAVDQMTIPEIALALAIPEGTAKSRLHSALETLRQNPELALLFAEL